MTEFTADMTSSRPYLLRAMREWIIDNGMTPYVLVDISHPGLLAPMEYGENGKLVLNISTSAVEALNIGNGAIEFSARFGGVAQAVHVPMGAVMAVYARENGRGMAFADEDGGTDPDPGPDDDRPHGRPSLKVVK